MTAAAAEVTATTPSTITTAAPTTSSAATTSTPPHILPITFSDVNFTDRIVFSLPAPIASDASLLFADIDHDANGDNEIVVGCNDGRLLIFKGCHREPLVTLTGFGSIVAMTYADVVALSPAQAQSQIADSEQHGRSIFSSHLQQQQQQQQQQPVPLASHPSTSSPKRAVPSSATIRFRKRLLIVNAEGSLFALEFDCTQLQVENTARQRHLDSARQRQRQRQQWQQEGDGWREWSGDENGESDESTHTLPGKNSSSQHSSVHRQDSRADTDAPLHWSSRTDNYTASDFLLCFLKADVPINVTCMHICDAINEGQQAIVLGTADRGLHIFSLAAERDADDLERERVEEEAQRKRAAVTVMSGSSSLHQSGRRTSLLATNAAVAAPPMLSTINATAPLRPVNSSSPPLAVNRSQSPLASHLLPQHRHLSRGPTPIPTPTPATAISLADRSISPRALSPPLPLYADSQSSHPPRTPKYNYSLVMRKQFLYFPRALVSLSSISSINLPSLIGAMSPSSSSVANNAFDGSRNDSMLSLASLDEAAESPMSSAVAAAVSPHRGGKVDETRKTPVDANNVQLEAGIATTSHILSNAPQLIPLLVADELSLHLLASAHFKEKKESRSGAKKKKEKASITVAAGGSTTPGAPTTAVGAAPSTGVSGSRKGLPPSGSSAALSRLASQRETSASAAATAAAGSSTPNPHRGSFARSQSSISAAVLASGTATATTTATAAAAAAPNTQASVLSRKNSLGYAAASPKFPSSYVGASVGATTGLPPSPRFTFLSGAQQSSLQQSTGSGSSYSYANPSLLTAPSMSGTPSYSPQTAPILPPSSSPMPAFSLNDDDTYDYSYTLSSKSRNSVPVQKLPVSPTLLLVGLEEGALLVDAKSQWVWYLTFPLPIAHNSSERSGGVTATTKPTTALSSRAASTNNLQQILPSAMSTTSLASGSGESTPTPTATFAAAPQQQRSEFQQSSILTTMYGSAQPPPKQLKRTVSAPGSVSVTEGAVVTADTDVAVESSSPSLVSASSVSPPLGISLEAIHSSAAQSDVTHATPIAPLETPIAPSPVRAALSAQLPTPITLIEQRSSATDSPTISVDTPLRARSSLHSRSVSYAALPSAATPILSPLRSQQDTGDTPTDARATASTAVSSSSNHWDTLRPLLRGNISIVDVTAGSSGVMTAVDALGRFVLQHIATQFDATHTALAAANSFRSLSLAADNLRSPFSPYHYACQLPLQILAQCPLAFRSSHVTAVCALDGTTFFLPTLPLSIPRAPVQRSSSIAEADTSGVNTRSDESSRLIVSRFHFGERTACFVSGTYSLECGIPSACLLYATYQNELHLFYDIMDGQSGIDSWKYEWKWQRIPRTNTVTSSSVEDVSTNTPPTAGAGAGAAALMSMNKSMRRRSSSFASMSRTASQENILALQSEVVQRRRRELARMSELRNSFSATDLLTVDAPRTRVKDEYRLVVDSLRMSVADALSNTKYLPVQPSSADTRANDISLSTRTTTDTASFVSSQLERLSNINTGTETRTAGAISTFTSVSMTLTPSLSARLQRLSAIDVSLLHVYRSLLLQQLQSLSDNSKQVIPAAVADSAIRNNSTVSITSSDNINDVDAELQSALSSALPGDSRNAAAAAALTPPHLPTIDNSASATSFSTPTSISLLSSPLFSSLSL